jgi:HAD superfamily hydrolase (TIGR01484 family)
MTPSPWASTQVAFLKSIQVVCLDIDETLSTRGKLTAAAYAALWALKDAGLTVVPVTGRPAGWCDHIARFWPVDAVIGENGAFAFYMQDGVRRRLDTEPGEGNPKPKIEALGKKIHARFPKARWASDQAYREYDLAIDVCEDVLAWKESDVQTLLQLCRDEGAHAKLSSIHVNAWFGDYDKRKGLENWAAQGCPGARGLQPAPPWSEWIFIGDSPNDEPLFEFFPSSVGVANLKRYLDKLAHPPRWITSQESGAGFCEMAQALVAARA